MARLMEIRQRLLAERANRNQVTQPKPSPVNCLVEPTTQQAKLKSETASSPSAAPVEKPCPLPAPSEPDTIRGPCVVPRALDGKMEKEFERWQRRRDNQTERLRNELLSQRDKYSCSMSTDDALRELNGLIRQLHHDEPLGAYSVRVVKKPGQGHQISERTVQAGVESYGDGVDTDLVRPKYETRPVYSTVYHAEIDLVFRFRKTLFTAIAVPIIWTIAYFLGFPPPQRVFFPDETYSKALGTCHIIGEGVMCAEKIYRESHDRQAP